MKILIACELSAAVRDAFRERGHDAWSCDLEPCEGNPQWHIQGDVFQILDRGWDLMIAHPDCTYLCVSGLHWNKRGRLVEGVPRAQLTEKGLMDVKLLLDAPIQRIAVENPVSCISTRIRKPDQIIQPWMFGDDASKKTCLWLKNLPNLDVYYPNVVPPAGWGRVMCAADMLECEDCGEPFCPECDEHYDACDCIGPTEDEVTYKKINGFMFANRTGITKAVWGNQTPSGQNKLGPSADRAKLRGKTYQGIANAMAEQWGAL